MVTVARTARCPASSVAQVLADGWTYAAWVVGTSRIRAVDPTWPAPRARISHSVGLWPVLIDDATVVLEWVPDQRLVLQARGWPLGEAQVVLELADDHAGGCTVAISEDVVRGPGTWVPRPLRAALLRPRNVETLRRLVHAAEGRVPPGQDVVDAA